MGTLDEHLQRAEGFLELGLHHEAWEELEKLEPAARAHPDVLSLRLDILLALERWEEAIALGTGCCRKWQTHDGFFLRTADALMRLADYEKATALLRSAQETLRSQAEYHYMIARAAALRGLLEDAKKALRDCFHRDKFYRERALDDPDLRPVWDSFR
jgi:predicted Zn-dependent protease